MVISSLNGQIIVFLRQLYNRPSVIVSHLQTTLYIILWVPVTWQHTKAGLSSNVLDSH